MTNKIDPWTYAYKNDKSYITPEDISEAIDYSSCKEDLSSIHHIVLWAIANGTCEDIKTCAWTAAHHKSNNMFSKNQINKWLELNAVGDNNKSNELNHFSTKLKLKLVEAKVLIDRWDLSTNCYIVHSSHKEFLRSELKNDNSFYTNAENLTSQVIFDNIWGADIHYSDNIPVNVGLALALDKTSENYLQYNYDDDLNEDPNYSRSVATFPM